MAVRCRPMNSSEKKRGETSICVMDKKLGSVSIQKPDCDDGTESKTFTFDYVYAPDSKQIDVFNETARPIVDSVLGGYNGTIFAYGQTGTGKTFSMEGIPDDEHLRGIMPNTFHHVIASMANKGENTEYMVRMSFIEIYNEGVYDLLQVTGRKKLDVKESKDKGVFVKDLTMYVVKEVPDMMKILATGQGARQTGATAMNAGSSRSHSILAITVETSYKDDPEQEEPKYKVGKLNLVDLAGSERQKRTGAKGDRLDEAKSINLSLSALGNVIKALVNPNAKHIPFRDSKLTRLLQDSLGGNTKTCMLAAMSPGAMSFDETMSTLRYANRAKNIKNKPKINEDPKDAMLREYQEQISLLKAQLQAKMSGQPMPEGLPAFTGAALPGMMQAGEKIVQENIIEQVEVVDTGISDEDMKELQKRLEEEAAQLEGSTREEREHYIKEKTKIEEEAHKTTEELKRKEARAQREDEELQKIKDALMAVEENIGRGQLDLEQAEEAEKLLAEANNKLEAQKQEELKTLEELEQAEEEELLMEEHYANAKDELKMKAKKLKSLWVKYNEKKEDMEDMHEEFALEREDFVDTIRALDRQIKLKHLMVDSFIPPTYVDLIEQSAIWDSVNDRWVIGGLAYAANNIQRQDMREDHMSQYMNQDEMLMSGHQQFDMSQADMEARYQMAMSSEHQQKEVFFSYGDAKKKKKKNR